jgi:hypothetical protein
MNQLGNVSLYIKKQQLQAAPFEYTEQLKKKEKYYPAIAALLQSPRGPLAVMRGIHSPRVQDLYGAYSPAPNRFPSS